MRIIFTILLATLLGGGAVFLWLYYGGFEGEKGAAIAFVDSYGDYAEVADTVEAMVHLPGMEGNVDRAELQALLESILTENITEKKRDTLARLAYTNLDTIKKEIDAAQTAQAEVYKRLQDLDNAARQFTGMQVRSQAEEVVEIARKRAELSARITSTLSEVSEHTYAIVTRILEDGGALTSEHATLINQSTSMAEDRHDMLSDLYTELTQITEELKASFQKFVDVAL